MPYRFPFLSLSHSFEFRSLIRLLFVYIPFRPFREFVYVWIRCVRHILWFLLLLISIFRFPLHYWNLLYLALSLWEILWLSFTSIGIVKHILKIFENKFLSSNLFPLGMFILMLFWIWICWLSIEMLTTVILDLSSLAIWETQNSVPWFPTW